MSHNIFSPLESGLELAWEAEFDRRLTSKKRGAKPIVAGQLLAASSWLDGQLCWHGARVCIRHQNALRPIEKAAFKRTGRVLQSLAKRNISPEVVAKRQETWNWIGPLLEVEAPDLHALCSPSRRANPAAISRLKTLLVVEALSGTPLDASPARALVQAWPLSRPVLLELCHETSWPRPVGALAALCLLAAEGMEAVPGPWRRVASMAVGLKWLGDSRLAPMLVALGALEGATALWRYVALAQKAGELPFDNAIFREQCVAECLDKALEVGEAVASVSGLWPEFSSDMLPQNVPFPLPMEFRTKQVKLASGLWRQLRRSACEEFGAFCWELGRQDAQAIPAAAHFFKQLLELPLEALACARPLKKKGQRVAMSHEPQMLRIKALALWSPLAMALVRACCDCEKPREVLEFMAEVCAPLRLQPPTLCHYTHCPSLFTEKWIRNAQTCFENTTRPAVKVALRYGADLAREAWKKNLLPTLDDEWPSHEWVQLALYMGDNIGHNGCVVGGLCDRHRTFTDVAEARHWLDTLFRGTVGWSEKARSNLCYELVWYEFRNRSIARAVWFQFPQYLDLLSETVQECPDSECEFTRMVLGLIEQVVEGRLAPENLRPFVKSLLLQICQKFHGRDIPYYVCLPACLTSLISDTPVQLESAIVHLLSFAEREAYSWSCAWGTVKELYGNRALMRALRLSVEVSPERTIVALERLGMLIKRGGVGDSDFSCLETDILPVRYDATWNEILELDAELEGTAQEWRSWAYAAQLPLSPPSSVRKVLEWPKIWAREVEALSEKLMKQGELSEVARERCSKRLLNLQARLADDAGTRAAMSAEIREALGNASRGAALTALESIVTRTLQAQLRVLCGVAAREVEIDADILNALLLACEVHSNRKWARQILRQHCEGNRTWREVLPANERFLKALAARGVSVSVFLSRFERQLGDWTFWIEEEPVGVLQMGNRFNTCLSRDGCNAHSSIANAIDLNKRVVYARDKNGHIVGRQLWGVASNEKLVGFYVYSTLPKAAHAPLKRAFTAYARDFVASCGLELSEDGEVERLVVMHWYDDGLEEWELKEEPICQTAASTPVISCVNSTPVVSP